MRRESRTLSRGMPIAVLVASMVTLLEACALPLPPTPAPTLAPLSAPTDPQPTEKPAPKPTMTPTPLPAKVTGTPIRIGYLAPLTGPLGPLGHLEKVSLLLAEEDVSKEGGIGGSPLQTVRYDSSGPRRAADLVRQLADKDRALAVLGPFSDEETDIMAPLANELQIAIVGTRATSPGKSEKHRPWAFRITVTDDLLAKAVVVAFKRLHPNVKKVLIVGDIGSTTTESLVKAVWPRYLAEAGYEVQGTITYGAGATDYRPLVTLIKDRKPEAIAYAATPQGNPVAFARELAAQQVMVPVMTSVHLVPGLFVYQAAKETEGWLSASFFNPTDPDLRLREFVKRWQAAADQDPDVTKPARLTLEANAYDALQVFANIIRKANIAPNTPLQEARIKVRDGLQSLKDYKGVSGAITMQASGDATWSPTPVIARNGGWVVQK